MTGQIDTHPDAIFESLLSKGGRSNRRSNLEKMHKLCRDHHAGGGRDFTVAAIGRLAEAQGIMKGRALYNAQSADYRTLIEAWATYVGPVLPAQRSPKPLASHEYLMRIEDPAIRSIMQSVIAERDRLKAQLNVLKSNSHVTVDRRPLGADIAAAPDAAPVAVIALSAQLTPSERESLTKAVSPEYLEERGFREGTHGEILNVRGRTMFEVGFARAIRKVLEG